MSIASFLSAVDLEYVLVKPLSELVYRRNEALDLSLSPSISAGFFIFFPLNSSLNSKENSIKSSKSRFLRVHC